jgi:hypothetical protein
MEWISLDKLPPHTGAYLITDGRMIGEGYWSPGVVLFQRTVVLLSFYVLSSLIVKVSHCGDRHRDVV